MTNINVRIFLSDRLRTPIVYEYTVPSTVFSTVIVQSCCITHMQTLIRLEILQFGFLHGFVEDPRVRLLDSHFVRGEDELEEVPEFGVGKSCAEPRVEVRNDAHGDVPVSEEGQQFLGAVARLPASGSFVNINQMRGDCVQLLVVQIKPGILERTFDDHLPPLLPTQAGIQAEIRMFLVHLAPVRFEVRAQRVPVAQHAVHCADLTILLARSRSELQQGVCHVEGDQT